MNCFGEDPESSPPTEPVETQIVAQLIVILGSAPEVGFVHGVQKPGNEIVAQTGM